MNNEHRQLVDDLGAFPSRIAVTIAGLDEAQLRRERPGADFSILWNVAHVRDLELEALSVRIRRLLSEMNPVLETFDGTAVAAASRYNDEHFSDALAAFTFAASVGFPSQSQFSSSFIQSTGSTPSLYRSADL
jgi:hypothetical protein